MNGKHSFDVDPDYDNDIPTISKRRKILENEAKESNVKKMEVIIRREFSKEISHKEREVELIDQRLREARILLDRVRACAVASYYSPSSQSQNANSQPAIHPAVRQCVGKTLNKHELVNWEHETTKPMAEQKENCPSKLKDLYCKKKLSELSDCQAHQQSSQLMDTDTEKKRIVVGNVSKFIPSDHRDINDHATHKWMVYVRGPQGDSDISSFVSQVWFYLHPSYKPNDIVKVCQSPFFLTRRGWGEFPVRVQLHFTDGRNKKVDIIHHLKLDRTFTGLQTLGSETVVDVELVRDLVTMIPRHLQLAPAQLGYDVCVEHGNDSDAKEDNVAAKEDNTSAEVQMMCLANDLRVKEEKEDESYLKCQSKKVSHGHGVHNSGSDKESAEHSVIRHQLNDLNKIQQVIKSENDAQSVKCEYLKSIDLLLYGLKPNKTKDLSDLSVGVMECNDLSISNTGAMQCGKVFDNNSDVKANPNVLVIQPDIDINTDFIQSYGDNEKPTFCASDDVSDEISNDIFPHEDVNSCLTSGFSTSVSKYATPVCSGASHVTSVLESEFTSSQSNTDVVKEKCKTARFSTCNINDDSLNNKDSEFLGRREEVIGFASYDGSSQSITTLSGAGNAFKILNSVNSAITTLTSVDSAFNESKKIPVTTAVNNSNNKKPVITNMPGKLSVQNNNSDMCSKLTQMNDQFVKAIVSSHDYKLYGATKISESKQHSKCATDSVVGDDMLKAMQNGANKLKVLKEYNHNKIVLSEGLEGLIQTSMLAQTGVISQAVVAAQTGVSVQTSVLALTGVPIQTGVVAQTGVTAQAGVLADQRLKVGLPEGFVKCVDKQGRVVMVPRHLIKTSTSTSGQQRLTYQLSSSLSGASATVETSSSTHNATTNYSSVLYSTTNIARTLPRTQDVIATKTVSHNSLISPLSLISTKNVTGTAAVTTPSSILSVIPQSTVTVRSTVRPSAAPRIVLLKPQNIVDASGNLSAVKANLLPLRHSSAPVFLPTSVREVRSSLAVAMETNSAKQSLLRSLSASRLTHPATSLSFVSDVNGKIKLSSVNYQQTKLVSSVSKPVPMAGYTVAPPQTSKGAQPMVSLLKPLHERLSVQKMPSSVLDTNQVSHTNGLIAPDVCNMSASRLMSSLANRAAQSIIAVNNNSSVLAASNSIDNVLRIDLPSEDNLLATNQSVREVLNQPADTLTSSDYGVTLQTTIGHRTVMVELPVDIADESCATFEGPYEDTWLNKELFTMINPGDLPSIELYVKHVVRCLPLVKTEQSFFAALASSYDQFCSWPLSKRRALEWQRAHRVRQLVISSLDGHPYLQSNSVWSTKQIIMWCRLHAYTPCLPEERIHVYRNMIMYPWTCAATFKSKISSNNNNDNNNTLTDSRKLMALLDELIHGKATVAVRDELIDITGDDAEIVDFGQLKEAIDQPAIKKHSAINALSPTARFVQDQCSKIGIWLRNVGIARDTNCSVVEDMIYAVASQFMENLLRVSYSAMCQRGLDGCKSELTQQDVIAAIQVNQQFDFLTNHHLGLRYDEIKEISQDSTSW